MLQTIRNIINLWNVPYVNKFYKLCNIISEMYGYKLYVVRLSIVDESIIVLAFTLF